MMNGGAPRCQQRWDSSVRSANNSSSRLVPNNKLTVAERLAAERALPYEERVRRALNLKPYLDYLGELFAGRLSDSSGSDDESNAPLPIQLQPQLKIENDKRTVTVVNEAIHTLNLMGVARQRAYFNEKLEQQSPGAFSPSNCYSSLGLSPISNDSDNVKVQTDPAFPLSDLELHNYLDKSTPTLNSPADDYLMSFLGSSSDHKRKRKWNDSHSSSICDIKLKCPSPGGIPDITISKRFGSVTGDLIPDDTLLVPGLGVHETGIGVDETGIGGELKLKDDPDKLLHTYGDFRDCMKRSITHDKLNLNQTAREDNDEECVDTGERKRIEEMDEDDDSLSDYMNITATSALNLDTYFKFDADELTASAESPMSPVSHVVCPPPPIHEPLNSVEIVDSSSSYDDSGMSIASEILSGSGVRAVAGQKEAKMVQMLNLKRRRIYVHMCRDEVLRVSRIRSVLHNKVLSRTKQLASMCSDYLQQSGAEPPLRSGILAEIRHCFRPIHDQDAAHERADKMEFHAASPHSGNEQSVSIEVKERSPKLTRRWFPVKHLIHSDVGNRLTTPIRLRETHSDPDENRKRKHSFYMTLPWSLYPAILFDNGLLCELPPERRRMFPNQLCIYDPHWTHRSLFPKRNFAQDLSLEGPTIPSEWSFSRILGLNSKELFDLMIGGFEARWRHTLDWRKTLDRLHLDTLWHEHKNADFRHFVLSSDLMSTSKLSQSEILRDLVFVSPTIPVYSFLDEKISCTGSTYAGSTGSSSEVAVEPVTRRLRPTLLPSCLHQVVPKVVARPRILAYRKRSSRNVSATTLPATTLAQTMPLNFHLNPTPTGFYGTTFPTTMSFESEHTDSKNNKETFSRL